MRVREWNEGLLDATQQGEAVEWGGDGNAERIAFINLCRKKGEFICEVG